MFVDVLPIEAAATDSSGVGRITLIADGKLIRNFTTGKTRATGFPKTLSGAIDWQGAKKLALGAHTITVHRARRQRQHDDQDAARQQGDQGRGSVQGWRRRSRRSKLTGQGRTAGS